MAKFVDGGKTAKLVGDEWKPQREIRAGAIITVRFEDGPQQLFGLSLLLSSDHPGGHEVSWAPKRRRKSALHAQLTMCEGTCSQGHY